MPGAPDSVSRRRFRGVQQSLDALDAIAEEVPLRIGLPSLPGSGGGDGGTGTTSTVAIVFEHGEPDGNGRIHSHKAIPLTYPPDADHATIPTYSFPAEAASGTVSNDEGATTDGFTTRAIKDETGTYDGFWLRWTDGALAGQMYEINTQTLVQPDPGDDTTWYSRFAPKELFSVAPGVGDEFTIHESPLLEFSSLEPGGWFHRGQLVSLFQFANGLYKARCTGFWGKVTATAPTYDPGGGVVSVGMVEVTPFDGEVGKFWTAPSDIIVYGSNPPGIGTLARAQTFPGTVLEVGEPVFCQYVGCAGDGQWLAFNVPHWFGIPGLDADDYANAAPEHDMLCSITDPDIPVDSPVNDALDELDGVGEA